MANKKQRSWGVAHQAKLSQPAGIRVDTDGDVAISSGDLPVPSDVYDADYAWLRVRNGAVSLFFAKASPGDAEKLHSRIEVRYPFEAFLDRFWKGSREFHDQVRQLVEKTQWKTGDREHPQPERMQARREHSVWANLDSISRHGTAAGIDFFHVPPDAIARFSKTKDLHHIKVQSVLRVLTTLSEVLLLLDECDKIAREIRPLVEGAELLVGRLG